MENIMGNIIVLTPIIIITIIILYKKIKAAKEGRCDCKEKCNGCNNKSCH